MRNLDISSSNRQPTPREFAKSIHTKHYSALRLYATTLCQRYRYDLSYVDDWMQDLLYEVMRKFEVVYPGYTQHGLPYLYKMIQNKVLGKKRVKNRKQRFDSFLTATSSTSYSLYGLCLEDYHLHLKQQLSSLLSPSNAALIIDYMEGYSYKDIAQRNNKSSSAVGVSIHRIKKHLRQHFQ